jgi:hypothetical protein
MDWLQTGFNQLLALGAELIQLMALSTTEHQSNRTPSEINLGWAHYRESSEWLLRSFRLMYIHPATATRAPTSPNFTPQLALETLDAKLSPTTIRVERNPTNL